MAPELIEGKAGTAVYGEAADIYSLAITLWDIAHPLGSKYPEATRSHLQVFDSVLNGERPPLSPSLHPELGRLLTEAWHQQPERRPSATYILTALETLQQEISAQTALGLATALERSEKPSRVNGQVLMQRMLELDYVDSASEAYRVGNSLMSAGFLHHTEHQKSFRKSSELFYFDSDVLDFCRKLGRGFETGERGQKRRFRRNKKWFAIMEESISTGKLRSHESHPSLAETDEFEDYATSGNWEDMESGATTRLNVSDVDEDVELDLESSANVDFESGWGSARSSVVII
ncbi:TKL/SHK protein kinase [Phytophthora cinnamomi]|nr:TKL/SHK protein kinase [Phytophthora cinnamomi]